MKSYCNYMKGLVSERGQIVIPKALRDRLGIRPGQVLEFTARKGRLIAKKAEARTKLASVSGIWKSSRSVDEIMDELRGKADP